MDLRERVLKDCDAGMRSEDVAEKYSVSASWVYALRKHRRETGSMAPKEYKRGAKLKLAPYEKEIRQLVAEQPDATLAELHAQLPNKDEVTVVTLHNFLHRLKMTWKKNSACRRTTSRGCCRRACRVEADAASTRHKKACFH